MNFYKNLLLVICTLSSSSFVLAQDNGGNLYDQVLQRPSNSGYDQVPQAQNQFDGGQPLKGRVVIAPAGSNFEARISTPLSSGLNNIGDVITATVTTPLIVGNDIVVPAGSQLIGQVSNAISARRFMAGSGGELDIRFTSIQLPNGQRLPLSATVDTTQFKLNAETGGSRTAKTVGKTAVGAGIGALSGLVGAAISGGDKSKGAALGTAIGGGLGLGKALVDKGREIEIPAGSALPVRLDQALQAVIQSRP